VLTRAAGLVERHRGGLATATARALDRLLETLPDRLAEVAGCGLPETLVHGDFHPGNVRGDGVRRVILDWADAGIGHPAQDIDRVTEALPAADAVPLIAAWADRWRADAPGSEPRRARALLRPVLALQAALAYADFLDHIEPSEWPYHRDDVPYHLARAAATLAMVPDS
jgi:Ser/Thr protein kinase RdoA (MazF antagonist)